MKQKQANRSKALENLLFSYAEITEGDTVLIPFYPDLNQQLACEAITFLRSRGITASKTSSELHFSDLRPRILASDVVLFLEDQKSSHSLQVVQMIKAGLMGKTRLYRYYNACDETLLTGFCQTRSVLQELNNKLIGLGSRSRRIHVESDNGTRLSCDLSNDYLWVNSCGNFHRLPGVLPPSEVATYSPNVNGTIIADGALAANMGLEFDPRLSDSPIKLTIADSLVEHWECDATVMKFLLDSYFKKENTRRVGEVGIGTNTGMTDFFPFFCHMNERYPSFHLGLGAHHQGMLCEWRCNFHLDVITEKCQIAFDDKIVHKNNEFILPEYVSPPNKDVVIGYVDTI